MEDKRGYYAVIPASVRYDDRLTPNAKLLYGEITALCNEKGFCWASNEYFSNLYDVGTRSIIRWINDLSDYGYITREFEYKEGSKEVSKRILKVTEGGDKNVTTYGQKCHRGGDKNVTDNNTVNNTTNINNIVEYLNQKAGTKYNPKTKDTVKHINARLDEKYTVDDFKVVIDKKCNEWIGTDMERYLRPSTLFGTKFENYLNQKVTNKRGDIDAKQRESIIDVAGFTEY